MSNFCQGCKRIRDIVHTDEAERPFCAECAGLLPEPQAAALLAFLAATIPYQVGDAVSCKTAGQIFDGTGHIVEVSFSPENLASPVVPMFRVVIDEKAYPEMPNEMWYSECCMQKVDA